MTDEASAFNQHVCEIEIAGAPLQMVLVVAGALMGWFEKSRLIRLARQVEVGEGAVDVRRHHLAGGADVGFVELVIAGDAQ